MSNIQLNTGTGGATLGTDTVSGVDYQIVKVSYSTAGSVPTQVDVTHGLPVNIIGSIALTANQGGAPWAENITQFGGNAVATGTGAGGVGIPRVTVSNDSNVLTSQSGTWTVQPGNTANTTAWKVDGSAVTQPVSGTVTTTPPANASTNVAQFGGTNVSTGTGAGGAGIQRVTVSNDSNVLSTQSGTWTVQPGNTANTTAWKVDGSAVTQPVSGTVTTTPPANASTNLAQVGGVAVSTGTGASGTGIPRVTVANDSNILTTQSGTWTVQPGNTANTTAWKVDGSAVTQPVSGTVTTTPPANASTNVAQFGGTNVVTGTGASGSGIPRVTVSNDSVLSSITNTVTVGGSVSVSNFPGTQPVSGTVTANQGTSPWVVGGTVATTLSPNASQETAGQLQRLADLMEAALLELRVLNALTATHGQPVQEDPDRLRADFNLSLN